MNVGLYLPQSFLLFCGVVGDQLQVNVLRLARFHVERGAQSEVTVVGQAVHLNLVCLELALDLVIFDVIEQVRNV